MLEVDLYAPVKAFLEQQGYSVKGEIHGCDLVAVRGAEPPVIVELKRRFSLSLVLQGVDRLAITDMVYLAVPASNGRSRGPAAEHATVRKLCRRLGVGLLTIGTTTGVRVILDPAPYAPRKNYRRRVRLLGEHRKRVGDPNRGGATRTPIVTAYRQEALRCARLLSLNGAMQVGAVRAAAEAPNAGRILYRNVYGWFERTGRGMYALGDTGRQEVERYGSTPEGHYDRDAPSRGGIPLDTLVGEDGPSA